MKQEEFKKMVPSMGHEPLGGQLTVFKILHLLAVLDLHCCTLAFSRCSEQRLLLAAAHRRLTAAASRAAARGLWARGLQ